jgi:MFS family permease
MNKSISLFRFLLFFLFGGVIVGETVSLSMSVSVLGSSIIGKYFFLNGIILFLLPFLFFNKIDKLNRGKLLSFQLLFLSCLLFVYLILLILTNNKEQKLLYNFLVLIIYPISYLSKTTLFITFWTIANDVFDSEETKQAFPKIAAWGFAGGLGGACISRLLLVSSITQTIIALWVFLYFIAFILSEKITKKYWLKLLKKEQLEQEKEKRIFENIKELLSNKLIKFISFLYFMVFIGIFLQDYFFWKKSALWFTTTNELASFQFSFYLIYSFIIILGLYLVIPKLITKLGFTKIFFMLPLNLFAGSFILIALNLIDIGEKTMFLVFIAIQFLRYVFFENTFSPIYQMFFAVIPADMRGRAKTFLDGIIKPAAIMFSGFLLILAERNTELVLFTIFFASLGMIYSVIRIRKIYANALIPKVLHYEPEEIISKIASSHDQKILSLIKEYSQAKESDIRKLAVKILARDGSKQAFKIITNIYENETNQSIKELIARNLFSFNILETENLISKMLKNENPRIRANALFSLNKMGRQLKYNFYETVKIMLFDNNPRVQIEAAVFLWKYGKEEDKENIKKFLNYLLYVKNANKRSAGLYLIGVIKPSGWEHILLERIKESSLQIFTKSIEVIFSNASSLIQLSALKIIETLPRRQITITGKTLQKNGEKCKEALEKFLPMANNKRLIVECIRALKMIAIANTVKNKKNVISKEIEIFINKWIKNELLEVYKNIIAWNNLFEDENYQLKNKEPLLYLEEAIREYSMRVCEWSLDALVILDTKGALALGRNEFDVEDYSERINFIELLNNFGYKELKDFIIPILKESNLIALKKIAKEIIKENDYVNSLDIDYFLKSSNKLICLCSLYILWNMNGRENIFKVKKNILLELKNSEIVYNGIAAGEILLRENKWSDVNNNDNIEPFELLERVMSLKKTLLFKNIEAEKLIELAETAKRICYRKGTLISREGELSDHLYIVAKGSLKIVKVKNNVKSILSIIRKGETYGEIGLFNQAPRSASAIANEDCELWVIKRSSLKKILMEMPEIAYNLLEVFSEKLKRSSEEVALLNTTLSTSLKE